MSNIGDIEKITESLNKNPMFRLSLGSKELFHSNFLEFLWEQNPTAFLEMLSDMIPENRREPINNLVAKHKNSLVYLELAREKEHFDLCIYHKIGNNPDEDRYDREIIYDVIIENKVKSIPYKVQLDKYVDTVEAHNAKMFKKNPNEEHTTPVFILISLAKRITLKNAIQEKWDIVNFRHLAKSIKTYRAQLSSEDRLLLHRYIADYYQVATKLDRLETIIKKASKYPNTNTLWYKQLVDIRLHDLYLKLTGSIFIGDLYKEIKGNRYNIVFGGEDRKKQPFTIFLSNSMNNGKATITAAILNKDPNKTFFVIQLEGNQYRHMIVRKELVTKCIKEESINEDLLKDELGLLEMKFINFQTPFDSQYNLFSNISDYCKYKPDCIYKHKDFKNLGDMLDIMAKDIINTYHILHG